LAGALFTLPNTVVVPYDLVAKPLFDERRVIGPARVQRYFLKAPAAGATLSAAVTLPDSAAQTATAYLFEPNGAPFRGTGHDSVVSIGGTRPVTARLVVEAEDLVPGVYELDVVAPPLSGVTATVRGTLAPWAIAPAAAGIEASTAAPEAAAGHATATLIGAERSVAVTGRGVPGESVTVRVPDWAGEPLGTGSWGDARSFHSRDRRSSLFPRDSRRSSRCASTRPTASAWTRSGGCRSHDGGAGPEPRPDRRRPGILGRLARGAVPPGDGRAHRLPHDGLPGRSDHVHPAEAEVARPVARVRQGLRAVDGAHPPARRRAGHQGHGQRGRREPARLRPGGRGGRAPAEAYRQAARRRRDGRRPAGSAGRSPGPRARAQEPRYGPAAVR